jgi:hypothetical protein
MILGAFVFGGVLVLWVFAIGMSEIQMLEH